MRADSLVYQLGAALTGTGEGVAIRGGHYALMADGLAVLDVQAPDGTWAPVTGSYGNAAASVGAAGGVVTPVVLPPCTVRIDSTDAAAGVNSWLAGIG